MATEKPFSVAANQKSGAKAAAISAASVVSVIGIARAFGLNLWPEENDLEMAAQITGAVALGSYLLGLAKNWWSNRNRPSAPVSKLPLWLLVPIAAVALQGCVATTPAFGGKTRAETTFIDADGTSYTRNIELPAGVQLEGQDNMQYQWGSDGSGNILIGQQGAADSLRQADTLDMGTQANLAMFSAVTGLVDVIAQLAAPLVGQNMTLDHERDMQRDANELVLRQQFGNLVDQKFDQLLPLVQEQQTQMGQLRQQLVQQGGLIDRLVESLGGLPAPVEP